MSVCKNTMIRWKDFLKVEVHFLKTFSIFVVLYWQLCGRSTTGYYLDYGKIGGQQLSTIWPDLEIPVAFSGKFYHTKIASSNLRDYDIRFLVSMFCSSLSNVKCKTKSNI
jgi:hypothetical protein